MPKDVQPLSALLPEVLRGAQQRHRALHTIQRAWPRLVGKPLATHTRPVSLRRGQLVVAADRPGDGFLLRYRRTELLERLRGAADEDVRDLIIRPSDGLSH